MNYAAASAPINYWALLLPVLLAVFGISLLLLLVAPPGNQMRYTGRIRAMLGVASAISLLVALQIGTNLHDQTRRCTDADPASEARTIRGPLRVVERAKFVKLEIGNVPLSSAGTQAPSECGLRASLAQSGYIQDHPAVEARVSSGAITRLVVAPP